MIFRVSVGRESGYRLTGFSAQGLHLAKIKVLPRLLSYLTLGVLFTVSCPHLGGISFLAVIALRSLLSYCQRGGSELLAATWPHHNVAA